MPEIQKINFSTENRVRAVLKTEKIKSKSLFFCVLCIYGYSIFIVCLGVGEVRGLRYVENGK